jgi:hypothetical protein
MTSLQDGLIGSAAQVLLARPEDAFDKEGKVVPFKWTIEFKDADTPIATARYNNTTYTVIVDRVKVSAVKDSHAEIEAAAKAPSASVEEKKALQDAKTVAEFAPDTKTKKEAEKVVSTYKK